MADTITAHLDQTSYLPGNTMTLTVRAAPPQPGAVEVVDPDRVWLCQFGNAAGGVYTAVAGTPGAVTARVSWPGGEARATASYQVGDR